MLNPARSASSARIRSGSIATSPPSVGYLSQRFSLYGDLSIDENIAFFAEIHGVRDYQQRRDRLLEMTQLSRFRDRLADQLSGGMKQKLALACTLVHEPEVILLDEPTTGVDPVSRREFWKLLSQFLASGITIVMSTPYLDEAERCGRIVLLHEGHVLALDEPGKLRTSMAGTWFEVMVAEPRQALDRLTARPEIAGAQVFGDRLHVRMDNARSTGRPRPSERRDAQRINRRHEYPPDRSVARGRVHLRSPEQESVMSRIALVLIGLSFAGNVRSPSTHDPASSRRRVVRSGRGHSADAVGCDLART